MTMSQTELRKAEALGGHDPVANVSTLMEHFKPAPQDDDAQGKYRKIMRATSGFQVDDGYARLTADDALVLVHFTPTDAVVLLWCELGVEQTFQNDRDETITFRPRTVLHYCNVGKGQVGVREGVQLVRDIKAAYLRLMAADLEGFGESHVNPEITAETPDGFE